MRPLIRTSLALLFLCLAMLNGFAGNEVLKPVSAITIHSDQILQLNEFLSRDLSILDKETSGSGESRELKGRICTCQILDLESTNYSHQQVVLLAEKTNNGGTGDYKIAKSRIQKEKKHLKSMFYDKVKVVSEMQAAGSCKSMFFRLKTADSHLQLYEILNADIY